MNLWYASGAVAAVVLATAHGGVGHLQVVRRLDADRLAGSPVVGEADRSWADV